MPSRDLPPLNALRAFEAVARLHSVTAAASELSVTHGAVSRQLRTLDEALGKPLFRRQGRGVALTDTGTQLHEGIGPALEQIRQRWRHLRRDANDGPLLLGCSGSLLARWVIPRLDRLKRELPALPLHLSAQEQAPPADLNPLDLALLLAAPPWPSGWRAEVLAPERIGPVLSPSYAGWARLKDQPAQALVDEPLLHTSSRPQAWQDWSEAQEIGQSLHMGQSFDHLFYLLEAAIAGLGVAIAPLQLVSDDLNSGRLLAPWGFRQTSASWVLACSARLEDARVGALADWLRKELARG